MCRIIVISQIYKEKYNIRWKGIYWSIYIVDSIYNRNSKYSYIFSYIQLVFMMSETQYCALSWCTNSYWDFSWWTLCIFTFWKRWLWGTQNLKIIITFWWWGDCEKICCRFVPVRLMSFHPLYLLRFLSIWRKTYVFLCNDFVSETLTIGCVVCAFYYTTLCYATCI